MTVPWPKARDQFSSCTIHVAAAGLKQIVRHDFLPKKPRGAVKFSPAGLALDGSSNRVDVRFVAEDVAVK